MHSIFPSIMKESTKTRPLSMHHEINITHASFPSNMKESTTALEKTKTLHHEGKLTCTKFPYITRTCAFPKQYCTMKEI